MKCSLATMARRAVALLTAVAMLVLVVACDRSPEDLERWRTAQGGLEQISEWVQDPKEPMDVRERGLQILIEEGAARLLRPTLEGIEDDQERRQIASAAMPTIQRMWDVQDFPQVDRELLEQGGEIAPEGLQAIHAIESLYHLLPYLDGAEQSAGQAILRDWISEDQIVRTQWAEVAIPLLVPLAGEGAMEGVQNWIIEGTDVRSITGALRRHAPDSEQSYIDEAVATRARAKHPEIDVDLKHAINGAQSPAIVPYLKEVILDEAVSDQLFQIAVDTIVDVYEADPNAAAEALAPVVTQRSTNHRWAAATAILDAQGVAGLVTIANALPDDADAFGDDTFNQRVSYLCNYVNTNVDRGDFEANPDALKQLLADQRWTARALGLQCISRMGATDLADDVRELSGDTTAIHAWGQRLTVGQFADHVTQRLETAD